MRPPEKQPWKGNTRPLTGLIFYSVGTGLIAEVAAAKAFADSGLIYDVLVGINFGAITASFLQAEQIKELTVECSNIDNHSVFKRTPWKLLTKDFCVFDQQPLMDFIAEKLDTTALRKNNKQCAVNLVNTESGLVESYELVRMIDDDLFAIFSNTVSMPFICPFSDSLAASGIADNFPIFDKLAQKMDRLIIFVPNPKFDFEVKNLFDAYLKMLIKSFLNQMWQCLRTLLVAHSGIEIQIVQAPRTDTKLFDFNAESVEDRMLLLDTAYNESATKLLKLWGTDEEWRKQIESGQGQAFM